MAPIPEPSRRTLTLSADLEEVGRARRFVEALAGEAGFGDERRFDIVLAASEACANAIEHSPAGSQVVLTATVRRDRLELEVEGPGEFQLPNHASRERAHRGLGLPLMAKFADHLALYSGPRGGTLVGLTFYRPGYSNDSGEITPPWITDVLQESEFVSAVTEAVPAGLVVVDSELRLRWTNAAVREFLDEPYRSQSLEGVFIGDAVPGTDKGGILQMVARVSQTGERLFVPEYEFVGFARGTTYWRADVLPLTRDRLEPPYDVLGVLSEITEQVRQRKQLESASRSYRALVENSGLALALCRTVFGAEGRAVDFEYVEVNAAHALLTGHPSETFVGKRITEAIPGYSRELIDLLNRVALTGEPTEEEAYEPHLGRWYRLNVYSPEPGYFVSLAQDISAAKKAEAERREVEQALRESEERLRLVLDNSLDGINLLDLRTGRYLIMNPAQAALTGFSMEELNGITAEEAHERVHPDDRQVSVEQQRRIAAGENTEEPVEYRWKVRSGEYRWFSDRRKLVRDEDGRPMVLVGISRDISERKRAEKGLRESEELFHGLFANMQEACFVADIVVDEHERPVDFRLVEVNRATETQTGVPSRQFVGKTGRSIFPGLRASVMEAFGGAALTGQPAHFDSFLPFSERHYEVSAYQVHPGRFAAIFTDVTECKRAEHAAKEAEQRTAELLERLQRPFLAIPESVPGVEFDAAYHSATTGALVGGDFYDVYRLPDGRLTLVVGDVSGHGLEASRFASMVKDSFNLLLLQGESPRSVLAQTNRFLTERLTPGFVTAFLGLLDLTTGELTYASAGHPRPLVTGGLDEIPSRVHPLDVAGAPPLAAFPDGSYGEGRIVLQAGEVLLLFTDGITDVKGESGSYGDDGLAGSLQRHADASPAELVRALIDDALAYGNGEFTDDVALLAVRFRGGAARHSS